MGTSELKSNLKKRFSIQLVLDKLSLKYKNYMTELYMSNDLLFSLTYMASISTANLTRDRIFVIFLKKKEYCPSIYFNQIRELAQNWHYDYAHACELISEKVTNERLKELLNRLANAIAAGEPDDEFLKGMGSWFP